jgi:hypothetical protein
MRLTKANIFDVWVVNPKTGEQIQKHFEGVTLAGSPAEYWAGPSHLVFPLQFEKDEYNWMVWDPFADKAEMVSARLPGIGTAYEMTYIAPIYDPRFEQVVYPCDACGEEDFRSYHVPSQRVVWAVEFGDDPFEDPEWQPVWSEDGEMAAFYFGLNKLWIVNRDGESILKAILPYGESEGWAVNTFSWSPDGKQLAMFRNSKDPDSPILSILSIEEGKLVNLCAQINYGSLGWSYDSRYIFYVSHRSTGETESVIVILDTTTGEGWQEVIPEDLVFTGWLKP